MTNGKGDGARPKSVTEQEYAERWARTFGRPKQEFSVSNVWKHGEKALSDKEWAQLERGVDVALGLVWAYLGGETTGDLEAISENPPHLVLSWCSSTKELSMSRRHALAALGLYGQPYGFTHHDIARLRAADLHDVADRIAALLPPESA